MPYVKIDLVNFNEIYTNYNAEGFVCSVVYNNPKNCWSEFQKYFNVRLPTYR